MKECLLIYWCHRLPDNAASRDKPKTTLAAAVTVQAVRSGCGLAALSIVNSVTHTPHSGFCRLWHQTGQRGRGSLSCRQHEPRRRVFSALVVSDDGTRLRHWESANIYGGCDGPPGGARRWGGVGPGVGPGATPGATSMC